MKDLLNELKPRLLAIAGFSFFMNLLLILPSIYMMQVFDRVLTSNSQETLLVLFVGTVIGLLFLLCLDYIRNRLQHVIGNIIDERLSPPVVNTLVGKAARSAGTTKLEGIRDVGAVKTAFSANGLVSLFDAPWVIVYVAVIWFFHPVLGMAAAAAALVMLGLAWLNDRVGRRDMESLQQQSRRASMYVENSMRNAEILQALGMTQGLLARWQDLQGKMAGLQTTASRNSVTFTAISRFVRQAVQVIMMSLGAYLVLTQHASPGIMIATTILLGRAIQPVEQVVGSWRMLVDARAAFYRLQELAREFDTNTKRVTLPRPEGRLTVDSLSYRAPGSEKPILLNVSLGLEPGEALAIIGPSAAGKSTLARILTGIWPPVTGSVRLDGADLAYWPRQDVGPWIGYVPQDVELFDGSVADNIARLGQVDSQAVVAAATRANAHDMILALPQGYDTQVGDGGARLSPGQRQRIALARALFGDPRLVILDEPNSNLDNEGEIALAQAMSSLRKEGVTSVVVTHRPSLIAHVDKVLVLNAGRVQQFGPAREVMKAMQQQAQVIQGDKAA
jgi:PrtD family type I secretion system ABC transporter